MTERGLRRLWPKERVSVLRAETRYRNPHTVLHRNSKAWVYHIIGLDGIIKGLFGAKKVLFRMQVGHFGVGDSLR